VQGKAGIQPCSCPKSPAEAFHTWLLHRRGDKPGSLGIQPAKALPSTEQQQLADHCKSNEYAGLFNTLDMQLRHWQEQGISTQLMDDGMGCFLYSRAAAYCFCVKSAQDCAV
jgi:hypothetical protein